MLRFFKTIRRKLIERGTVTKYLIYALGEILLVIIGILVALQVANWNEGNKLRKREITIYKDIRSEIEETKKDLISDTQGLDRNAKYAIKVRNILVLQENLPDTLRKYLPQLYNQSNFNPKTSAFESLKSTGLDILTNDSIRNAITDLYQSKIPYLLTNSIKNEHDKFPDKFWPLIKRHLKIDMKRVEKEISEPNRRRSRRYFPYQIKDLNALFGDEQIIITVQESINWRTARIGNYRGVVGDIERVENIIDAEILRLEKL